MEITNLVEKECEKESWIKIVIHDVRSAAEVVSWINTVSKSKKTYVKEVQLEITKSEFYSIFTSTNHTHIGNNQNWRFYRVLINYRKTANSKKKKLSEEF